MKKVDQEIVCKDNGDCTRACLASILELPIDAVPNFIRFGQNWFYVFHAFLNSIGYEYHGCGWLLSGFRPHGIKLEDSPNIDGFVIASVQSRTFNDVGHSVVMNLKGEIVHDPNPNKLWQDVNVIETDKLEHWMMISKKEKNHGQR